MKLFSRLLSLVGVVTLSLGHASAQLAPGGADIPGLDVAMRKLFENVEGFTTEAVMSISGQGQKVKLTVDLAMLKGDTWMEINMARIEGASVPPQMLAAMRKAGMDRMQMVSDAKTGRELMIYPGLKAYAEAKPARTTADQAPDCKTDKKSLGTEEVEGKSCDKSDFTVKCGTEPEVKLTVWTDKKNKDLPVKLAMSADGTELTITFGELKLKAPDAKLFNVPAEYKQHGSVQELMMANMQKMMEAMQGAQ